MSLTLICFALHEGAYACQPAVDEVDQILFHAMKARRETLELHSINVQTLIGALPRDRVSGASINE